MYYDAEEIGRRLKTLREMHNMTQEEMAAKLNISLGHLSRMERGIRAASIDLLIEVAEQFHVSLDFLITGRNYEAENFRRTLLQLSEYIKALAEQF